MFKICKKSSSFGELTYLLADLNTRHLFIGNLDDNLTGEISNNRIHNGWWGHLGPNFGTLAYP